MSLMGISWKYHGEHQCNIELNGYRFGYIQLSPVETGLKNVFMVKKNKEQFGLHRYVSKEKTETWYLHHMETF